MDRQGTSKWERCSCGAHTPSTHGLICHEGTKEVSPALASFATLMYLPLCVYWGGCPPFVRETRKVK